MSFRIGRKFAQHTYPEPRGAGAVPQPFARNFASGPGEDQEIGTPPSAGSVILWDQVDVGPSGTGDVQITPLSTGVVRVISAIAVQNLAEGPNIIEVTVHVNGVEVDRPELVRVTMETNDFAMIPVLAQITGLPIGVPADVTIMVIGSDLGALLVAESSTIEVKEVQVSTG
jgi:hypothetical protein